MSSPAALPPADPVALQRTVRRLHGAGRVPWLHEEAARRMADRLPLVKLQPDVVLDWSGPLGASQALLRQAYPRARHQTVGVPQPPVPPRRWPWSRPAAPALQVLADDAVPAGQAQLLWANMMLHGMPDPQPVFERWRQALAVGGFLMFSTLGPGTLPELRAIYREQGWGPALAPPIDMHDLGDQLVQAGFADPVMDQELLTLTWADADALLRELRTLGANVSRDRHPGLRTPRWLAQLKQALSVHALQGRPALTIELVYGHAFCPEPRARMQPQTTVSVDDMRRMVRTPRARGS